MREYKEKSITNKVNTKVVCNGCGMTFDLEKNDMEEWQFTCMHPFQVYFGYSERNYPHKWEFDLCEDCIEKIVSQFKVPVTKTNIDCWGEELSDYDIPEDY